MADFDHILPITTVKQRLLELMQQLEAGDGAIAITKNGVATGVLLSMAEYEGLLETLEILSDRAVMKKLAKSRREAAAGKFLTVDEVFHGG